MRKGKIEEWVKGLEMKNGRLSVDRIPSKHLRSIREAIEENQRFFWVPNKLAGTRKGEIRRIWRQIQFFQKHGDRDIDKATKRVHYLNKIEEFVGEGEPIKIIFIAWPFKNYKNPLKTNRRTPDLGELIFVQRLLQINEAVKTEYPPGIEWTVLAEGEAYRGLLGASKEDVALYLETMKRFIKLLGGEKIIKIKDLKKAIEGPEFNERYQKSLENLRRLKEGRTGEEWFRYRSQIDPFVEVMFWSQDVTKIPLKDLIVIYYGDHYIDMTSRHRELRAFLRDRAKEIAWKYVAFNEAKTEIIAKRFPQHLYFSITYKPERFCFRIPTVRPPHHGIPVVIPKGPVEITHLATLLIRILLGYREVVAVYVDDDQEDQPFYYKPKEADVN
ncbi:L-tyrosine/L-tryptophan isonitrile synthase family protein [Patescibacteria group bacterium]|nr:L-tyrosine/L-tryptophan isonitrile synthase family protein [Patescibacteria group bacterium]